MLEIKKYLRDLVQEFWNFQETYNDNNFDIIEIVPLSFIKDNIEFVNYITERNNCFGENQIKHLLKLITFCKNSNLIDPRQEELRRNCLKFWNIPDKTRIALPYLNINDLLETTVYKPGICRCLCRNSELNNSYCRIYVGAIQICKYTQRS